MKQKILLAITAYRCEKQIVRTLDEIDDKLAKRVEEIAVIDNGSPDATVRKAISEELGVSMEEAKRLMVAYLGFGSAEFTYFAATTPLRAAMAVCLHAYSVAYCTVFTHLFFGNPLFNLCHSTNFAT
jgi:glycosyltransferase involved in cell wall biosynthesis